MRIFSFTGDRLGSPIVTVVAQSLEQAIKLGTKEADYWPWDPATIKVIWSFEIANFPFPCVITVHKPDPDLSAGILWSLKHDILISNKTDDGKIFAFTDRKTMFPHLCWFENGSWIVDPSTSMEAGVREAITKMLLAKYPNG